MARYPLSLAKTAADILLTIGVAPSGGNKGPLNPAPVVSRVLNRSERTVAVRTGGWPRCFDGSFRRMNNANAPPRMQERSPGPVARALGWKYNARVCARLRA